MRQRLPGIRPVLLLAFAAAACKNATSPAATLVLSRPPDFAGVVTSSTLQDFFAPSGYHITQYDVWLAVGSSAAANAGVVVPAQTPVFIEDRGDLRPAHADAVRPNHFIQVWHDSSVAYGAAQAPPGSPCYRATQIVIVNALP